jgi:hypothetical protein
MLTKSLIVEQLEIDGTIKTLRMSSPYTRDMGVAFADKYDEPRFGPFHFLDEEDELKFRTGFANCRARRLSALNFEVKGEEYHVKLGWQGIPTQKHELTYYAISLPQFAIPKSISISDPHKPGKEYRGTIAKDEERSCYVIYLDCSSSIGKFDFDLHCIFYINQKEFLSSKKEYANLGDDWKYLVSKEDREKIGEFLKERVYIQSEG